MLIRIHRDTRRPRHHLHIRLPPSASAAAHRSTPPPPPASPCRPSAAERLHSCREFPVRILQLIRIARLHHRILLAILLHPRPQQRSPRLSFTWTVTGVACPRKLTGCDTLTTGVAVRASTTIRTATTTATIKLRNLLTAHCRAARPNLFGPSFDIGITKVIQLITTASASALRQALPVSSSPCRNGSPSPRSPFFSSPSRPSRRPQPPTPSSTPRPPASRPRPTSTPATSSSRRKPRASRSTTKSPPSPRAPKFSITRSAKAASPATRAVYDAMTGHAAPLRSRQRRRCPPRSAAARSRSRHRLHQGHPRPPRAARRPGAPPHRQNL